MPKPSCLAGTPASSSTEDKTRTDIKTDSLAKAAPPRMHHRSSEGNSIAPTQQTNLERSGSVLVPKPVGNAQGNLGHDTVRSPPDRPEIYNEVLACLVQFQQQVTEGAALSFEREKAKKLCEQREEEYEKFESHHANYPPILEQQTKEKSKARKNFDAVIRKVALNQAEMQRSMESLALRIISGGIDTTAIHQALHKNRGQLEDLEKRFQAVSSDIAKTKDNVSSIDRTVSRENESVRKQLSSILDELAKIKATDAGDEAKRTQVEQHNVAISTIASRLDTEVAKIRDDMSNEVKGVQDLLGGPVRSLEQKFELMDREIKKTHSQQEQNHKLLGVHGQHLERLEKFRQQDVQTVKTVDSETTQLRVRVKALESTSSPSMLQLQAADHKRLSEDVAQFKKRVDNLELRPHAAQSQGSMSERSVVSVTNDDDAHKLLEGFISKIETIGKSFEQLQNNIAERFTLFERDNDEIYGKNIDVIQTQISRLETKVPSLASGLEDLKMSMKNSLEALGERHNSHVQGIVAHQTAQWAEQGGLLAEQGRLLGDLQKELQVLKAPARTVDGTLTYAQNSTAFVRQASSSLVSNVAPMGRQSGSPVVNFNDQFGVKQLATKVDTFGNKLEAFANELEGVKMGTIGLSTRFNNLTTDALARQMLSQLDQVYPHLRDATKEVAKLGQNLQALCMRVDALEQRKHTLPAGLRESLEKFDQDLTALGHRTLEVEEKLRLLQIQASDDSVTVKGSASQEHLPNRVNENEDKSENEDDALLPKRKGTEPSNGSSKRQRTSRRIVQDTDDEREDNGHSDA